eukprot:1621190-Prymnesium_polylepis.2
MEMMNSDDANRLELPLSPTAVKSSSWKKSRLHAHAHARRRRVHASAAPPRKRRAAQCHGRMRLHVRKRAARSAALVWRALCAKRAQQRVGEQAEADARAKLSRQPVASARAAERASVRACGVGM